MRGACTYLNLLLVNVRLPPAHLFHSLHIDGIFTPQPAIYPHCRNTNEWEQSFNFRMTSIRKF